MGNSNILRSKFGCQDVSRSQYLDRRSKGWNFQQNYLYQTEIEQVGDQNLKVITYEINLADRNYETYFQRLNMMSKYLNKGNIQLPLLCISESKEECSCSPETNEIVKFYYQSYDVVLMEEMKARVKWREGFSEKQLWYILYNVINALRQFQPFFEPSGNLSPQEILMNNRGEVKVKTFLTSPFEEHRVSTTANCFAPEELDLMKKVYGREGVLTRNLYKQYQLNPNICQVYSLAVILLSLVSGRPYSIFYDPPFEISQSAIKTSLKDLQSIGYSKLLINLLKIMLTSYENRPLPSQIHQIFKQFEHQIFHFQPFSFSLASSEVKSVF